MVSCAFFLIAGALALAAACSPAQEADSSIVPGCDLRAASQWVAGEETFSVEATTAGPDCQRAVATIALRNSSGVPIYAEAHLAENIMLLAPAHDTAAMQTALQEWVTYDNHTMSTTSALPDWPVGAEGPQNGEFPFHPAEGYVRESYMALRASNLPLFCYVQGMESLLCLVYGDGGIEQIGVQQFPG